MKFHAVNHQASFNAINKLSNKELGANNLIEVNKTNNLLSWAMDSSGLLSSFETATAAKKNY